jgi:hypothetical protein
MLEKKDKKESQRGDTLGIVVRERIKLLDRSA